MNLSERIVAFAKVGAFIKRHFDKSPEASEHALHQGLDQVITVSEIYNHWFIPKFVNLAIENIGSFLTESELSKFAQEYKGNSPKTVALVCAGNIPLVCFHDVMCVLLSGHKAVLKLSSDDKVLPPFFLKLLTHYEPRFEERIFFAEGKLSNFDAVIATGSNNTASHLHYYFGKYPNIIRKNRSSLAIITGNESTEDLQELGKDIFFYFGLGCRNVNKLMVPAGYDFSKFFEAIVDFGYVVNHNKYGNNYDYHRALFLLESIPFLDNNFVMIRENAQLHSPVGVIHYSYDSNAEELNKELETLKNELQCVVGKGFIPFGYSQSPVITDFADNVNTLDFLVNL
jgi:hypothetical protein